MTELEINALRNCRDAVNEIIRDELEAALSAVVEQYDTEKWSANDAMKTLSDVFCFYSGVMRRMKETEEGTK